jgi:putative hydrolase of the HAD superfamily
MNIFFDVDGVLIDGFHAKPERSNRWDKTLKEDLGLDPETFSSFFIHGPFVKVLKGQASLEEELDHWLLQNDCDLKAWQVMDYWHQKDSNINPDIWAVVKTLAANPDHNLYVATNQSHDRAGYLWHDLNFKAYFKDMFHSARIGHLKHEEGYFEMVEGMLGIDPVFDPPLYFDDDSRNIDLAKARGWNAILVDVPSDVVHKIEPYR